MIWLWFIHTASIRHQKTDSMPKRQIVYWYLSVQISESWGVLAQRAVFQVRSPTTFTKGAFGFRYHFDIPFVFAPGTSHWGQSLFANNFSECKDNKFSLKTKHISAEKWGSKIISFFPWSFQKIHVPLQNQIIVEL